MNNRTPPPGKARDYAPGEEQYQAHAQKTLYRDGYNHGLAGSDAAHNPYTGKTARAIWETGRARARRDLEEESRASHG